MSCTLKHGLEKEELCSVVGNFEKKIQTRELLTTELLTSTGGSLTSKPHIPEPVHGHLNLSTAPHPPKKRISHDFIPDFPPRERQAAGQI